MGIVWISGPHRPGTGGKNDLSIFQSGLKHLLDYGEQIEADDGYQAECPSTTKMPSDITCGRSKHAELNWLQQNCHERVNERLSLRILAA